MRYTRSIKGSCMVGVKSEEAGVARNFGRRWELNARNLTRTGASGSDLGEEAPTWPGRRLRAGFGRRSPDLAGLEPVWPSSARPARDGHVGASSTRSDSEPPVLIKILALSAHFRPKVLANPPSADIPLTMHHPIQFESRGFTQR